ncbi:4304_t:CDS:2 [Acaulospora colombiana]|uniref:4304_t:CDS:1 n=1 Tax=Acaulospora colombiana TaxID=27376 RepID=A0ACA9LSI0_9GLOM|nr:4304_t:CDS:2 [Acaulospora colombiana]
MLPGWDDVTDESHIDIERVSGAFTNSVFFVTKKPRCTKTKPQKVILRIYGNGIDQLVEREKELVWLRMLSTVKIGPQLLGTFKNGRIEEYYESTTLTKDDIRMAPISRHIASRMFQFHNIVKIFPPRDDANPEVWVNIDRWYPLACKIFRSSENKEALDLLNLLRDEIPRLKVMLSKIDSPIVFAHNDTQYGNILRLADGSNQLVVVDFEYAGYNYRGFDIGNHFCEWAYDYSGPDPHVLHRDWYPNEEEQLNFLEAYLETQDQESGSTKFSSKDQSLLQKMLVECNAFALASHMMWGIWGLVQSFQSEIEFDYLSYGIQRLNAFNDLKEEHYRQIKHHYDD